jgi:hypothetical protein
MTERSAARRLPFPLHLKTALPLGFLAWLTIGAIDRALAADVAIDRYSVERTAGRADKDEKDEKTDPLRSGPLFAVVSIADQRISVYGNGGLLARSSVSTGVKGHPTPTGVFSIVQKRRWHHSNIYSGAAMPLMQRITWSGIALHAGHVPGYPASHGCIRLPPSFAQRLFGATKIGQRVMIVPSDAAPVEMTHQTLPAPKLFPAPEGSAAAAPNAAEITASVDAPEKSDGAVLQTAGLGDAPAAPERLNPIDYARAMKSEATSKARAAAKATKAAMQLSVRKSTELRLAVRKLTVAERAAENAADALADASRELGDAEQEEASTKAAIAERQAEAAKAEAERRAEAAKAEVKGPSEAAVVEVKAEPEAPAAAAQSQPETAVAEDKSAPEKSEVQAERDAAAADAGPDTDAAMAEAKAGAEAAEAEAAERAERIAAEEARAAKDAKELEQAAAWKAEAAEAKTHAEAAMSEARKALDEARAVKETRQRELDAARSAAAEAKAAGRAAAKAIAEATRRLKPLSVFISRKTARLYVRQDFEPLFDVPVSIRDADREIGTHLYVSTRAAEDGSALHWQAVSMPVIGESKSASQKRHDRKAVKTETEAAAPEAEPEPETARGALDRVTIPEETSQRLAELAWVGASVIISDNGISGETGDTTDFIILTRPKHRAR